MSEPPGGESFSGSPPPLRPPVSPPSNNLIEEYKALRSEILERLKELNDTQRTALFAIGAIWAWLGTHAWQPAYALVRFVPSALCVLFGVRWFGVNNIVIQLGRYLKEIEAQLGLGWEKFKDGTPTGRVFRWTTWSFYVFWLILLLANIIVAALFYGHPEPVILGAG